MNEEQNAPATPDTTQEKETVFDQGEAQAEQNLTEIETTNTEQNYNKVSKLATTPKNKKYAIWMSKETREAFDKQHKEKGFKKREEFLKNLLGI